MIHPLLNIDSLSTLEHMPEETRDNVCLACFLLKIHDTLEVGLIFCLIDCSSERYVDVIPSDPLVEVIFNLEKVLKVENKTKNILEAYHHQHKSDGSYWKSAILGKLGVNDTFILFILKPSFIDDGLYQRRTK